MKLLVEASGEKVESRHLRVSVGKMVTLADNEWLQDSPDVVNASSARISEHNHTLLFLVFIVAHDEGLSSISTLARSISCMTASYSCDRFKVILIGVAR